MLKKKKTNNFNYDPQTPICASKNSKLDLKIKVNKDKNDTISKINNKLIATLVRLEEMFPITICFYIISFLLCHFQRTQAARLLNVFIFLTKKKGANFIFIIYAFLLSSLLTLETNGDQRRSNVCIAILPTC